MEGGRFPKWEGVFCSTNGPYSAKDICGRIAEFFYVLTEGDFDHLFAVKPFGRVGAFRQRQGLSVLAQRGHLLVPLSMKRYGKIGGDRPNPARMQKGAL